MCSFAIIDREGDFGVRIESVMVVKRVKVCGRSPMFEGFLAFTFVALQSPITPLTNVLFVFFRPNMNFKEISGWASND